MPLSGRLAWCLAALSMLLGATTWVGPPAQAVAPSRYHAWGVADTAPIHPGTQLVTGAEQCTADFVFTDAVGHVYVGYAAHCAGTGGQSDTNGCTTGSVPLGTTVRFLNDMGPLEGGTPAGTGRLVYSSWITMHQQHTRDPDTCAYNDFALVQVDPSYRASVNPSVPYWGGPLAVARSRPGDGAPIFTWGQSGLRPTSLLSPKRGLALGSPNGWTTTGLTVSPGIPGDSGSGFMDATGRAFGVLSTVAITPIPGSNGIGSLARELAFAQATSGIRGLALASGTEPFVG